jgi:hypothetical protein
MTESDLSVVRERADSGDKAAVDELIELAGSDPLQLRVGVDRRHDGRRDLATPTV